MSVSIKILLQT